MNVTYVTDNCLCTGCGVCKSICPAKAIKIILDHGENRPQIDKAKCLGSKCGRCLKVCPGVGISFSSYVEQRIGEGFKRDKFIGMYYQLYVGYSCDNNIRYHSASGGMVTTFLIYLLEKQIIDGAVVTRYLEKDHVTPEPFIARTREEVISARSSKYCPVSMEEVRDLLSDKDGKYVIVGLPCHIQAFKKLSRVDKKFREKVFGLFSIYCSSNRSFGARDFLLNNYQINRNEISYFAFRDNGCLGNLTIFTEKKIPIESHSVNTWYNDCREVQIPFSQYYGKMLKSFFKPHRCLSCVDHYGELADVCFGDIHIKPYSDDHIGISSWIVRNKFWNDLFVKAMDDGYIKMDQITPDILNKSQAEMLFPKMRRARAVMNMDKLLGRKIAVYDRILDKPQMMDYIKEVFCHVQRFIGRRPYLWFIIKALNKIY